MALAPLHVDIQQGILVHGLGSRPMSPIYTADLIKLVCVRVECEKRITFRNARERFFQVKMRQQNK